MKTEPNAAAYPVIELHKWKETVGYIDGMPNNIDREERVLHPGLSKLEAFTLAAMQGIIHCYDVSRDDWLGLHEAIAGDAVRIAKATIDALNKEEASHA